MKKTLIALAALAATTAFAQSSVTMYGNYDIGYGAHKTTSKDATAFTKTSGVMDGSWAGSRLGFRGTEDLGGGLTANFVIEQGLNVTSNNTFNQRVSNAGHQIVGSAAYTPNNNRQTYAGISGNFGEVRAGFQYTNSYDVVAFQGYSLSEFQGGNYQNATHANGTRANSITYIAPKMGDITIKAQYGSADGRAVNESNADTNNGFRTNNNAYMSFMAAYAKGPLNVAYAYSNSDVKAVTNGAATTNIYGGTVAAAVVTNNAERSQVSHNIGASYNLGFATVSATMGRLNNGGSVTTTDKTQTNASQFSAKVPFGAADLLISTGKVKATNQTTNAVTTDSSGTMFGVSYALSKRTNIYALTGSEKNEAVAAVTTAGYKDSKNVIGLRHAF
jgi:predicted porin